MVTGLPGGGRCPSHGGPGGRADLRLCPGAPIEGIHSCTPTFLQMHLIYGAWGAGAHWRPGERGRGHNSLCRGGRCMSRSHPCRPDRTPGDIVTRVRARCQAARPAFRRAHTGLRARKRHTCVLLVPCARPGMPRCPSCPSGELLSLILSHVSSRGDPCPREVPVQEAPSWRPRPERCVWVGSARGPGRRGQGRG